MRPTLSDAFRNAILKGRNLGPDGQAVTIERVTAIVGNGVEVRGVRLPVAGEGLKTLRPGSTVAVAWKGGRPVVAIAHSARRSGAPTPMPSGIAIVEVLFIAGEAGARDVYFRNDQQVTKLEIRAQLAGDPEEVKWGARGDDFFVRVGGQYYTFLLDRNDADEPVTSEPEATLLRPPEQPWDGETLLSTMTHNVSRTVDTPCVFFSEVSTFDDGIGGVDHLTGTGGLASSLVRNASFIGSGELRLTQDAAGDGHIEVLDAQLDHEHSLVLTLKLRLFGTYTPRPTGSVKEVATKVYDRQEQPPGTVVSESGDSSAIDGQPDLGSTDIPLGSTEPDGDTYAAIVNVTKRTVVWKSILSTPVLTEAWHTYTNLAGAEARDITTLPLVLPDARRVTGQQKLNQFPTANPTTPTPPGGSTILLPITYAAEALLNLQAIDTAKLGFLTLGDLVAELTTSPLVLYGTGGVGAVGDVTIPPGSPSDLQLLIVQGTFTEHRTYRPTTLFLDALRYLPHRTKPGGDLLLFARKSLHNGISQTGTQYSFWRVDTVTGAAKVIAGWTAFAGEATPTVLGASLQHVLWTLRVRNPLNLIEQITTVYLSDTEHGTSKVLVTGTVTSGEVPPAVAAFLARSWEVLRPDLLYLLDDADPDVSNEFLEGWTEEAVTLDPAAPEVAGDLAGLGALAELPEDIVPVATPPGDPSVRALERSEVNGDEDE